MQNQHHSSGFEQIISTVIEEWLGDNTGAQNWLGDNTGAQSFYSLKKKWMQTFVIPENVVVLHNIKFTQLMI